MEETLSNLVNIENNGHLQAMENFRKFNFLYESAINIMDTKLKIIQREYSVSRGYNPIHSVETRIKDPKSIIEKLRRKNLELSLDNARRNIKDIAGVRIVCNYIGDVKIIAEMLRRQLDLTVIDEKDYVAEPKKNGYRSYHMVFSVPVHFTNKTENVPVEVQIRTIAMDFWASLEHKLRYKKDEKMSLNLQLRLKACAEISNKLDEEMENINRKINEIE